MGFDFSSVKGLSEFVDYLRAVMPLRRFTVVVLLDLSGLVGLSHVRMCRECYEADSSVVCSCFEIVLSSREELWYSLAHEWGHVFLGETADPIFASTIFCSVEDARILDSDLFDHVEGSISDAIVDVVVSERVEGFSSRLSRSLRGFLNPLTQQGEGARRDAEANPWLCTLITSTYIQSKALSRDEAESILETLREENCGVNSEHLKSIALLVKKGSYLEAYKELLITLTRLYEGIEIEFENREDNDPISGEKIKYTCIKTKKSQTNTQPE